MEQLTKEELIKTGFQSKFQFGTRVETPCGKRGIVNFYSEDIDLCRVYYDDEKVKSIEVKITECRILSIDEAVDV